MSGTYADIVEIVAPGKAAAGSRVDITVKIKNLYSSPIGIMAGGALEYGVTPWPGITFPNNTDNVAAGATHSFAGYFYMPESDVVIHAYSYYYASDGYWYFDDEETKRVSLAAAEEFKGTITRMELEYDESRASIPAYNIPQGKRGLVHIWGRNDMSSAQRMGIYWVVKDPDGIEVEEYSAWEAWPYTGTGKEHEFIGGRFDLDKAGTYTINVGLLMNPDAPTYVDTYYGTLCTVKLELASEFSQFEIADYRRR